MRKTTVCIDEELLGNAMRLSGARSKKETIEKSLKLLVNKQTQSALKKALGTFDLDLTPDKLERLRNER